MEKVSNAGTVYKESKYYYWEATAGNVIFRLYIFRLCADIANGLETSLGPHRTPTHFLRAFIAKRKSFLVVTFRHIGFWINIVKSTTLRCFFVLEYQGQIQIDHFH